MIRKVVCVWLLVQLLTGCTAQEKKKAEFGGEVIWHTPKEITYFTYKPKVVGDSFEKGDFLMAPGHLIGIGHKRVFDEKGRLIENYNYSKGDTVAVSGRFWTYLPDNMEVFETKSGPPPYPEKGYESDYDYILDSLDVEGKKLWQKKFMRFYDEEKNMTRSRVEYIYIYI